MPPRADRSPNPGGSAPVSCTEFAAALTDAQVGTPAGILGPGGSRADKRFNVYRNNVAMSLINALADIFPAIRRLVGETFFQAMARVYVQTDPPSSPLLFRYGEGFPRFLESFEPAREFPYLPDVARLERAWLDAYHAADVLPLQPDTLGTIPPHLLPAVRFRPHPASAVIRSPFAAVTIFSANRQDASSASIDPAMAEDGLVCRPGQEVLVRQLPKGAALFFTALLDGQPLGEAAEAAVTEAADFDLAAAISAMLESGLAAGIVDNQMPENEG